MIRFATMKYYVSRGYHARKWDPYLRRHLKVWVERRKEQRSRDVSHVFIYEGGRWRTPCGLGQSEERFTAASEHVLKGEGLGRAIEAYRDKAAPVFFQKRCAKCLAWIQKNGEALATAEAMGE